MVSLEMLTLRLTIRHLVDGELQGQLEADELWLPGSFRTLSKSSPWKRRAVGDISNKRGEVNL